VGLAGRAVRWPQRWWARQSLRARLTLLATALFTIAVGTGAVLLLVLQRYSLTRVLDQSAAKTGRDLATQIQTDRRAPEASLPSRRSSRASVAPEEPGRPIAAPGSSAPAAA